MSTTHHPPPILLALTASPRPVDAEYWADSASSQLGPGGGIQRIGFDQAMFEAAYKEVVLENTKAEWPVFRSPLDDEAEGEAEVEKDQEGEGEKAPEKDEPEAEEGEDDEVQVNKDDIALIASSVPGCKGCRGWADYLVPVQVRELEIERSEAEGALRKASGDLTLALKSLVTAPVTL